MRSFDYLTLYQNSPEVESILAAIDSEIDALVAEVERVRNMCFVDTAGEDIQIWLEVYQPKPNEFLTDAERVKIALQNNLGATKERIKYMLALLCNTQPDKIQIIETTENTVTIILPFNAVNSETAYADFLADIIPAHIGVEIIHRAIHEGLSVFTHDELNQYTHGGIKYGE